MLELIKNKIWSALQSKDVSLVMIYNREGEILWHQGRQISGRTLKDGAGFSTTLIRNSLQNDQVIEEENQFIHTEQGDLPGSARFLRIKSILILPMPHNLFLYIDSGCKKQFTSQEREVFRVLGELLSECIRNIVADKSPQTGITGDSLAVTHIKELILKYSLEDDPILLLGETGVGKSHIAQVIHFHSGRKGRFLTVNTPAIPENLFESEIFGHKRGAFTDAKSDRNGAVETAVGGTLFFDEIAEIPLSMQAKLLHFLETKHYSILGDSSEKTADVRIIAATNRNLPQAIRLGEFREDLYYRLSILEITIPPLRERKQDIQAIIAQRPELLKNKETDPNFWSAMMEHSWPGNIRELFSVLKRLTLLDAPLLGRNEVLKVLFPDKKGGTLPTSRLHAAEAEIVLGGSFWQTVWPLFIDRYISRDDLHHFLCRHFNEHSAGIKELAQKLNVASEDFKKFIAVLHKYDIHPRNKKRD